MTLLSDSGTVKRPEQPSVMARMMKPLRKAIGKFKKRFMTRDYDLIAASGLFDEQYYLSRNTDVVEGGFEALRHFVEFGWREGRNPNSLFDSAWYLETYPDVDRLGINPLVHYIRFGGTAGRDPSSRFDGAWYLEEYPDVREGKINPLAHYLNWGKDEGRLARSRSDFRGGASASLSPFESWLAVNEPSDRDFRELQQRLDKLADQLPKISVITPVYNTDRRYLEAAVESVVGQLYENWELCLVNDASPAPHIRPLLDRFAIEDPRIVIKHCAQNGGISRATNAGVAIATGDVVLFLDHDDLLEPTCLAEIALEYAQHDDADIVYSDDDKIDAVGRRYAPQFKPDWSPTLLLSWMYISHVFSVRRSLFLELGGFRPDFDGSQDYDFALRAAERARYVGHIPKILYHWRAVEGSTATGGDAKPESMQRGLRAVNEALERRGIRGARAFHPDWAALANVGMFDVRFPDQGPSVTLIVPTRNRADLLRNLLDSLEKTSYQNYSVLILDNESDEDETLSYFRSLKGSQRIRVVRIASGPNGFSFAKLNNDGVGHTSSDYVLFLNNDTEVINDNWLSQMIGYAQMSGVGAVGARLYFEDGTLQHGGIVHGYHEGLAGHAFRGLPPHDWGYLGFVRSTREYSAVTAACLLTPRALFEELGGFDDEHFSVAYNDVDYCYRIVKAGKTCVYCASAELWHYEGKTRGFEDDPAERANFRRIYGGWKDRWYNPNLSLEDERFQVAATRPETIDDRPVRLVAVTHNLNSEGAPQTLMDLVVGLTERGLVDPVVLSPADGPLRREYEAKGVKVVVLNGVLHGVKDADTQAAGLAGVGLTLKALGADVVLANTLQTYWAVKGARMAGIPSIFAQHESEPWETYFDFLPPDMRPAAYESFADAYRVTYVAEATRRAWRPVESRRNFEVIRHGIPAQRLSEEVGRWDRETARKELGLPKDAIVLSVVGTVCRRKGQLDLIEAWHELPDSLREKTYIFLAGKLADEDYTEELRQAIGDNLDFIVLTDRIEDPFLYYAASDISVCTSRVESAPRIIVEAMACGLPIITTPVFGIPELVRKGVNALFYEVGDSRALAEAIERLLADPKLMKKLAQNSPKVLEGQPGFEEMVDRYASVIRQAANLRIESMIDSRPKKAIRLRSDKSALADA